MFSSFPAAVLGLMGEKPCMTAQAQASYVAGSPVPLPLPPTLASVLQAASPGSHFCKLTQVCSASRGAGSERFSCSGPSAQGFWSDAPRRARNAREKPRFGQGFHTLRLDIDAEPRPKLRRQKPRAAKILEISARGPRRSGRPSTRRPRTLAALVFRAEDTTF